MASQPKVTDTFWRRYMDVVRDEVIPYQWEALNDRVEGAAKSHAIENIRIAAGLAEGEFHGFVFQDSDVAKWLEAVAYSLATDPNPELEKTADELIDLLGNAQQEDGYLNTYFTVKEPNSRWTNLRDQHELYCAGHMIEAAVAYYEATGKRKLLDIMCRFADCIDSVFGEEDGKIKGYDGHQEIELALVKLYEVTGNEKYLNLSKFFIDERGKQPHFFDKESEVRGDTKPFWYFGSYKYSQSHLPVREQQEAVGHSVRAMYMYAAMADLAFKTGDDKLKTACKTLWDNVTNKQMYITAGIGSSEFGEAFSFDYDLPNDLCYTETCASIGLVFWAKRMLNLEVNSSYADVMERALYNGTISGMDLDGKKFFYVNPLEVWPEACSRHDKRHVKPVRQMWFNCACCPPNLARLIASIGHYIYTERNDEIFVNLYMGNEAIFDIKDKKVYMNQKTEYPWDGTVSMSVSPEESMKFTIALRIPGWCRNAQLKVNGEKVAIENTVNGYVYLKRTWNPDDQIELILEMPVDRIKAHPSVRENVGKTALQMGPIVYCLEEVDNSPNLPNIFLPKHARLETHFDNELLGGVVVIKAEANRLKESDWGSALYKAADEKYYPHTLTAVPYYAWCNREPGEMLVWMNEK
ncbi:glycoside hydrolase family 127 protein [Bacillus sp. FJAT-49732]|uniref:Glycoside hydrolase family 127 protein n=1 Tax=Lederbergia citrisecunda TaxID=2833583 RepID=A0A942TMS2_9BACI|nr:beta-L-arabinofuranosidase domain-containing protein [Lederbergia citrisecunda]MBS4200440.1 glycoside hydrolase family 127 protein [Lederbergia citrisecunda]